MKQITLFLGVSIFSALFLLGCKKEQPSLRDGLQDCGCAKEVSADFTMEEMTTSNPNIAKYTLTDSIYGEHCVRFTALEENAEYTWYIGSEILHSREVIRLFPNDLIGQSLPMTLVVKKKPNSICLPSDEGYDSIVQKLIVARSYENFYVDTNHLLEGKFRLKATEQQDSLEIVINLYQSPDEQLYGIELYNYDGNGSNSKTYNLDGRTYRQIWFDMAPGYRVNLFHKMNGVVELNLDGQGTKQSYHYLGRKIV